jgi:tRNA (mo5U34)-methyltransferase
MSEIAELRKTLQRYEDELRALRDELEPAERMRHEGLRQLRDKWLATFEQLQMLQPYVRDASYGVEAEDAYAAYFRALNAGERERDPGLERDLLAGVQRTAPTNVDDPRLVGWYHTIELGDGLRSTGRYDLRACVAQHGLPDSLAGRSALDVGTCDGFWAFEMERLGADRVVGMDIEWLSDFDFLPAVSDSLGPALARRLDHHFWLSHALRASRVEHTYCSVYELSPETVGVFDVVFCGSLLLHLQNPMKAMANIRSVTREMAVVATQLSEEAETLAPNWPLAQFGNREPEVAVAGSPLGASCVYWKVNTRTLQEMMEYAGFARTEAREPVPLPPMGDRCAVVVGYP